MYKKPAKTPPLGWNSWDCFGAAVNEKQLRENAEYMAKYLKPYGWEYIVCDIQWYEPHAVDNDYNNFTPLNMDEYGRLLPAENRFPSSAGGKGFKPIADYCHSLGLKFGIHIMRGVPRAAVHAGLPVKDSKSTCRDIAHHFPCARGIPICTAAKTAAARRIITIQYSAFMPHGVLIL